MIYYQNNYKNKNCPKFHWLFPLPCICASKIFLISWAQFSAEELEFGAGYLSWRGFFRHLLPREGNCGKFHTFIGVWVFKEKTTQFVLKKLPVINHQHPVDGSEIRSSPVDIWQFIPIIYSFLVLHPPPPSLFTHRPPGVRSSPPNLKALQIARPRSWSTTTPGRCRRHGCCGSSDGWMSIKSWRFQMSSTKAWHGNYEILIDCFIMAHYNPYHVYTHPAQCQPPNSRPDQGQWLLIILNRQSCIRNMEIWLDRIRCTIGKKKLGHEQQPQMATSRWYRDT